MYSHLIKTEAKSKKISIFHIPYAQLKYQFSGARKLRSDFIFYIKLPKYRIFTFFLILFLSFHIKINTVIICIHKYLTISFSLKQIYKASSIIKLHILRRGYLYNFPII